MLGLGLGLGIGAAQTPPLARYNIGGKAPAVVADFSAGVYGLNGAPVAFDGLSSFARSSAAWKLNALGQWVEVASGEPRTGHHIVKDGAIVTAGVAGCSEVRTNLLLNSDDLATQSVTVTAVEHTLSFTGAGTVTLSGAATDGPLVGTGSGEVNRVTMTFTPSAGSLTLTVSGDVENAKLETGPYATDYISSEGTPFSTAAESLQIDAAVLARAIGSPGPELWDDGAVVVGDLWTNNGGGSYTKAAGGGSALTISNGSVPNGSNIVFSVKVSGMTGGSYNININGVAALNITSNGDYDFVATAGSSPPDLAIIGGLSADGTVSMISARQVTMPDAVSIAIEGYMTYEGNGLNPEIEFINYSTNNANRIISRLQTASGTGRVYFFQTSEGVPSTVQTGADAYSPGINVPFSIAVRHGTGSDSQNGAYNGNLLTAASPAAIPDLIAEAIQIATIGNMSITRLLIFADDIGDAGLVGATE